MAPRCGARKSSTRWTSAKVMLLAITGSAARSHNVAKEVTLFSERKGSILPVHLEQTTIPAASSIRWPASNTSSITTAIRMRT